jgi:hypothetical protein
MRGGNSDFLVVSKTFVYEAVENDILEGVSKLSREASFWDFDFETNFETSLYWTSIDIG